MHLACQCSINCVVMVSRWSFFQPIQHYFSGIQHNLKATQTQSGSEAMVLSDYRNDLKFSDRYAWANSADPDQTAPRGAV